MHPLWKPLRLVYYLLYHPFAWTYDWVAAVVSLGRWRTWVQTVLPYLEGERLLEVGHGPGHLQEALLERGLFPFGLDESAPMGRLALRNLQESGHSRHRLARGLAQALPYPASSFQTVVATFPSEYILDPRSLAEIRRVLVPGGRLVVLPLAWPTGRSLPERFFTWLFHITGVTVDPARLQAGRFRAPFEQAGFQVKTEELVLPSSRVFLILAQKAARQDAP